MTGDPDGPPGSPGSSRGSRRRRGTGHELRQVVLDATAELLAGTGDVEALTMRAVATAAGVTAPSVYRHFPDKRSLVQAVISDRFAAFTAALRAAADRGGDPLERLAAMAHAYVTTGLGDPGTYRVLFSATNAGPAGLGLAPGAAHPGAAAFQVLLDAVTACLPPPAAEPDPQSVPVLAIELWASLHGLVDLRITKPEMPWPDPAPLVRRALNPIRSAVEDRRSR